MNEYEIELCRYDMHEFNRKVVKNVWHALFRGTAKKKNNCNVYRSDANPTYQCAKKGKGRLCGQKNEMTQRRTYGQTDRANTMEKIINPTLRQRGGYKNTHTRMNLCHVILTSIYMYKSKTSILYGHLHGSDKVEDILRLSTSRTELLVCENCNFLHKHCCSFSTFNSPFTTQNLKMYTGGWTVSK